LSVTWFLTANKMDDDDEHTGSEAHHIATEATIPQDPPAIKLQRPLSLYDAVAGRAGQNGFLTKEQTQSQTILPLAPEDVLRRKTNIPAKHILETYDAAGDLPNQVRLPESEMLKAVHAYASEFYALGTSDGGSCDFRSLDETALIAMGILLEEAVRETLGENGDMVFVEPEGLEQGLEESTRIRYQVQGKVKAGAGVNNDSEDEVSPAKRRKH
jgi:hypothetical protein